MQGRSSPPGLGRVSLGQSASAGLGYTASQRSLGGKEWASTFRAPLGALDFCEKPIFTLKNLHKPLLHFSFLCVCFDANHLAVDSAGEIQTSEAVDLNSTVGPLRASQGPAI